MKLGTTAANKVDLCRGKCCPDNNMKVCDSRFLEMSTKRVINNE